MGYFLLPITEWYFFLAICLTLFFLPLIIWRWFFTVWPYAVRLSLVATCTLHTDKRVINDSVTGCVSVDEVEYTFCSGSCGDSNYMPLIVPSGSTEEGFSKTCKCCTGESSSEKVISVRCGPLQTLQQAKIKVIDSCSCDICSMTGM